MSELFSTALNLLLVGMITVFVVLLLVYLTGTLLILIVNRYFPGQSDRMDIREEEINPSVVAAITAAVDVFTKGAGKVSKIEKEK